jgi:multidrug efflux pump subunit AcrA (membrane-fusion protein)
LSFTPKNKKMPQTENSLNDLIKIPDEITLTDLTKLVYSYIAEGRKRDAERAAEDKKRWAEQFQRDAERAAADKKRKEEQAQRDAEYAAAEEKRRAEKVQRDAEYAAAEEKRRAEQAQRDAAEAARWAKFEKQAKRTNKQLGDLHNKFGRMEETLIVPSVFKLLNSVGYDFREGATCRNFVVNSTDGKIQTEIDTVFDNTTVTALLEVKTAVVKVEHIEHHIRRLQIYRNFCKRKGYPLKDLIGVFAGVEFAADAKQAAIDAGFFVVVPAGKHVKFDNPEGFKAKLY